MIRADGGPDFDFFRQLIREPVDIWYDEQTGIPGATFDPPLNVAEQATYDLIVAFLRSEKRMSPLDYGSIREQMQTLRALRQLGRNAFMDLTAAERDRMIYDALVAVTIILIGQYREPLQAAANR